MKRRLARKLLKKRGKEFKIPSEYDKQMKRVAKKLKIYSIVNQLEKIFSADEWKDIKIMEEN